MISSRSTVKDGGRLRFPQLPDPIHTHSRSKKNDTAIMATTAIMGTTAIMAITLIMAIMAIMATTA
jgi:hypothetical protein